MRPNIFLGTCEGSTQYKKWYFEVMVDEVEPFLTAQPYHLRVGWALTEGYSPYPGGGEGWGGNGVGDDLYSYGFDGLHLWSGKVHRPRVGWEQYIYKKIQNNIESFLYFCRTRFASRRHAQSPRPGSRGRGQLLLGSERAQYFLPYQRASCSGHV